MFAELFEFQLDIAQKHLDQGDSVNFLVCSGLIPICETTSEKNISMCLRCISRRNHGISLLNGNIKKYPIHLFSKKEKNTEVKKDTFENLEELKSIKIDSYPLGSSVLSSVADIEREHIPCTRKYETEIRDFLHTAKYLYDCMNNYIIKKRPDIVYVYNGRHATTRPIVESCKKNKIKFFSFEWSYRDGGYELCENSIVQDMDYRKKMMNKLWAENNLSQMEKKKIGNSFFANRYAAKSVYGKWYKINHGVLPEGWNSKKYNVTIFTSSEYEDFTVPEYSPDEFYKTQIDGIRKILAADKIKQNKAIFFYIRLHPVLGDIKEIPQEVEAFLFLEQEFSNCSLIMPQSNTSSYSLVKHSDKIVHFRSTIGAEAVMLNKPTIMLWQHFMNNSGSFYTPRSHNEVVEMILRKNMPPKPKLGVIKYGFFYMNFFNKYKYLNFCDHQNAFLFRGIKVMVSNFVENYLLYNFHRPRLRSFRNLLNKVFLNLSRRVVSNNAIDNA